MQTWIKKKKPFLSLLMIVIAKYKQLESAFLHGKPTNKIQKFRRTWPDICTGIYLCWLPNGSSQSVVIVRNYQMLAPRGLTTNPFLSTLLKKQKKKRMLYFSVWSLRKVVFSQNFFYSITLFHILNYLQFVLNIIHFFKKEFIAKMEVTKVCVFCI